MGNKLLYFLADVCYNICSAAIAQSVERIHGKDEVPGSNPGRGSRYFWSLWHSLLSVLESSSGNDKRL